MNKIRKLAMKFSYLILGKIVKIVATRGQILRQKCTKFDFGKGSASDPAGAVYSAPSDPLARFFWAYTSTGRKGRGRDIINPFPGKVLILFTLQSR